MVGGSPFPRVLLHVGTDDTVVPFLFTTNSTSTCPTVSDPIVEHP